VLTFELPVLKEKKPNRFAQRPMKKIRTEEEKYPSMCPADALLVLGGLIGR
jgi:hypothetical protein